MPKKDKCRNCGHYKNNDNLTWILSQDPERRNSVKQRGNCYKKGAAHRFAVNASDPACRDHKRSLI